MRRKVFNSVNFGDLYLIGKNAESEECYMFFPEKDCLTGDKPLPMGFGKVYRLVQDKSIGGDALELEGYFDRIMDLGICSENESVENFERNFPESIFTHAEVKFFCKYMHDMYMMKNIYHVHEECGQKNAYKAIMQNMHASHDKAKNLLMKNKTAGDTDNSKINTPNLLLQKRIRNLSCDELLGSLQEIMDYRHSGTLPDGSILDDVSNSCNADIRETENNIIDAAAFKFGSAVKALMVLRPECFISR